jgi:hypothetical protein
MSLEKAIGLVPVLSFAASSAENAGAASISGAIIKPSIPFLKLCLFMIFPLYFYNPLFFRRYKINLFVLSHESYANDVT